MRTSYWIVFIETYQDHKKGQFRLWGHRVHSTGTGRYEIFKPGEW